MNFFHRSAEMALLIGGGTLGFALCYLVFLPILYNFPKACLWALRGKVRWKAPFYRLILPALWGIFFIEGFVLLTVYFPKAVVFLERKTEFSVGYFLVFFAWALHVVFSKKARLDMHEKFVKSMDKFSKQS